MFQFLKIQIYRRKFYAYLAFSIIVCLTLQLLTSIFFINIWIKNSQAQALTAFQRVEGKLRSSMNQADAYMLRIYSNSDLMDDVTCFLGNSPEQYLTKRLEKSKYNESLYSFPDDIEGYFGDSKDSMISQISLYTNESANVIHFWGNGSTSMEFCVANDDRMFQPNIEKGFIYTKKLNNPNRISEQIGEIHFLISSKVFDSVFNYNIGSAMAVDASNNVYAITPEARNQERLIRQINKREYNQGTITDGMFSKVYYMVFRSDSFNYKFIYMIDSGTILRRYIAQLLFIAMVFLIAIVSGMALAVYNLKYDASFLGQMIQTINNVKVGDFSKNTVSKFRKNEYGMIARELNDMSQKLEQYIRTEYILKLRQQKAEMEALQHQINPHFLYNALETIRSLALVNHDEATAELASNLGGMYRGIVKNKSVITLEEELKLLQKYLRIMEIRYANKFYYQINIEPELRQLKTIKLWMQPLAENFFVHGFDHDSSFNLLIVSGRVEQNRYVIEFINNGSKIEEGTLRQIQNSLDNPQELTEESVGIRNVYARLRFFWGDIVSMKVVNNEEAGIKISVYIEKRGDEFVPAADC